MWSWQWDAAIGYDDDSLRAYFLMLRRLDAIAIVGT